MWVRFPPPALGSSRFPDRRSVGLDKIWTNGLQEWPRLGEEPGPPVVVNPYRRDMLHTLYRVGMETAVERLKALKVKAA